MFNPHVIPTYAFASSLGYLIGGTTGIAWGLMCVGLAGILIAIFTRS